MITVTDRTVIKHAPERVFETASDPHKQLEWDDLMTSVEKVTPGPLGNGARYRGDFKRAGRGVEYEFEEFEAPRRFTHRTKAPMGTVRHEFTLEPSAGGTQLTQAIRLDPNVLGRLGAPMLKKAFRRRIRQIASELAAHLDARKGASA